MADVISKNPLVQTICDGLAKADLLEYLLLKQLPLTEEEYLEGLVHVLRDAQHKERAQLLLHDLSRSVKDGYVAKREANHRVAYYILLEALADRDADLLTTIVHNNHLPNEFLTKVAEQGPLLALEALLENQTMLIAFPETLDVMERNPECTAFIRGKIKEIRDFYLQTGPAEAIPEADASQVAEALAAAEGLTEDQADEVQLLQQEALTTLQRINRMSVSERIKLAVAGSRTERLILIKDANKMVQMAVLESPKMSEDEVMIHVRDRSMPSELISRIASTRDWTKNYAIVLSLVQHPKTPVNKALGFIKQLHERDLKLIAMDKNISPVIRQLAQNFQRQKERVRG